MRIKALTTRILKQLLNDKRTIALVVVAPMLVLTLVYYVLCNNTAEIEIGLINVPDNFAEEIKSAADENDKTVKIKNIDEKDVNNAIENREIIAAVDLDEDLKNAKIYVDGTDNLEAKNAIALIKSATMAIVKDNSEKDMEDMEENISEIKDLAENLSKMNPNISVDLDDIEDIELVETEFDTDYIYGYEDQTMFDNYAAPLVGIIVFFFVYLLSGINFLTERTSGTLEKLLSTPIKRREIIIGYVLGFSILALVQTIIITLFIVYVLGVTQDGNIGYVLLVNLLTSITALTLGILLSTLANGEFQFIQFVPIIILPQVFLCGLFSLEGVLDIIGHFVPLYYTTDALKEVMLRGKGLSYIARDCAALVGFSVLFMALNIRLLKKQRDV